MRILFTGREGQLAQAMLEVAAADATIIVLGRPALDITDRESVVRAIATHRPEIVVNAAAYTAVDKAESEIDRAFAVNRDGAENVARAAAAAGLPVIQISTDYVFSGDKAAPYTEADRTGPASVYGCSKLAGEEAVMAANPQHVILRTAWVYSPYGANFVKTMLRLAGERDVIRVVADQRGTPTHAADIAAGILAVAAKVLTNAESVDWRGIFHMVSRGETTWAEFASEIFSQSAAIGGPWAKIEPIVTADYPTAAKRPANSCLDNTRYSRTFNDCLPFWADRLPETVRRLLDPQAGS